MKKKKLLILLFIGINTLLIAQDLNINYYIQGTLLTPERKSNTLAIIIPGSGPTDRDGNQNFMKNNSLKFLAQDLVNSNIATFRYDKRALTMLKKNATEKQIKQIRFDDFIEDTNNIIAYFRDRDLYDNIYIIGHSQGSLVGMIAAQKNIDGFISIAGAGKKIHEVILNQISNMNSSSLMENAKKTFDILENGKIDKEFDPRLTNIFNLDTQRFMMSWIAYSPSEEIKKLDIPILIINGTNDVQVSSNEAEILKESNPNATLKLIKNMNHVLKNIDSKDEQANTKSYNMPELPNSVELSKIIIDFIKNK